MDAKSKILEKQQELLKALQNVLSQLVQFVVDSSLVESTSTKLMGFLNSDPPNYSACLEWSEIYANANPYIQHDKFKEILKVAHNSHYAYCDGERKIADRAYKKEAENGDKDDDKKNKAAKPGKKAKGGKKKKKGKGKKAEEKPKNTALDNLKRCKEQKDQAWSKSSVKCILLETEQKIKVDSEQRLGQSGWTHTQIRSETIPLVDSSKFGRK
jgi:hypothetical protein